MTSRVMMTTNIKSQSAAAVHEAAETLLQTLAARLNHQHNLGPYDRIFADDLRQALAAAMAESVGPGVLIVWWDEVNGLSVNVAGAR